MINSTMLLVISNFRDRMLCVKLETVKNMGCSKIKLAIVSCLAKAKTSRLIGENARGDCAGLTKIVCVALTLLRTPVNHVRIMGATKLWDKVPSATQDSPKIMLASFTSASNGL